MGFLIGINSIAQEAGGNPFLMIWLIFRHGGWALFLLFLIFALRELWLAYIRNLYRNKRKYTLLAIDVPKENMQTPRGVENIFQHLCGAHATFDFIDKWWNGGIPDSFSFEIISLEGYIQFLIHMEVKYRDLIEAAIYAQYPDAEIVEVEDYSQDWKMTFPHPEYDLWGTEIKLAKKQYYPIKTHPAFEDPISEEKAKEPMAGLLEGLGKIGPGEQFWVQFLSTPADNDWGKGATPLIQKLIGAEIKEKDNIFDLIYKAPFALIDFMSTSLSQASKEKEGAPPNKVLYMTQGEKDTVNAIEKKISKLGFHVRIRLVYIAKKEVYDKNKGSKVLYGALKQFNTLDCNAFKPDTRYWTGALHFMATRRVNWRKTRMLRIYKERAQYMSPGDYGFILNTEEMASVYHFPAMSVKAPLIKRTESKKSEPPLSLPIEEGIPPSNFRQQTETKDIAPTNLPME
ncbi:hypothetical protein C4569_00540 [Candidatus Parcubacteria bacterium]|nr:MAG: hypothetical protein C4569_00540 [Candidatus Parcubacteria bacterium]